MPFETKLKARARPRRAPMRSSEGGCERIVPQHLFSKKFFQGENRSINRSCAICAWSPRDAGGSAWCRGDELGTNLRLTDGCLWTNRIGAQAPTFHPQKSTVVHMVIHRCESMVVGSEMSSDSAQNRRGIDPDSIRNRLEIVFDRRPSRTEAAAITDENGDGADPRDGNRRRRRRCRRTVELSLRALLDARRQLLDLVVDLATLGHLLANLLVRVHHRRVISAERLTDLR